MSPEDKNLNAHLQARLRFETLIADLSSKFVNIDTGVVDREIIDAERRICELLKHPHIIKTADIQVVLQVSKL
jgi:hypothetical protein